MLPSDLQQHSREKSEGSHPGNVGNEGLNLKDSTLLPTGQVAIQISHVPRHPKLEVASMGGEEKGEIELVSQNAFPTDIPAHERKKN